MEVKKSNSIYPKKSKKLKQKKSKKAQPIRSRIKTRSQTRRLLLQNKTKTKTKTKVSKTKVSKTKRKVDGNYKIKNEKKKCIIYTLEGCPYCKDAEDLLKNKGISFDSKIFENLQPEEQQRIEKDIQSYKSKEGKFKMTFPRIFDDKGNFRGGFNDVKTGVTYLKN